LSIFFHATEKRLSQRYLRKRREWILNCIRSENFTVSTIHFIFCSDSYLLEINQNFLKHDFFTDVITFPECHGSIIGGEIYISIDRLKENAKLLKIGFETELNRIMIHGTLHLMNYDDSNMVGKSLMTDKENLMLEMF